MKPKIILFFLSMLFTNATYSQYQFKQSFGFIHQYDEFNSVCETPGGNYLFFGNTTDSASQVSRLFLVKLTSDGSLLWSKTYENIVDVFGTKILIANNGDLIMMGYTGENSDPFDDIIILRSDSNGNLIWSNRYGGNDLDEGNDMVQDIWGNIVVAGYTYSFGSTLKSGFLLCVDENGAFKWSNTFAQNISQEFYGIIQTIDSGFFMVGVTQAPPSINFDGYMVKTDSVGNLQWAKRNGGTGTEILHKAWQDANGDFFMAGSASTNTPSGNLDCWLLKTDSAGFSNSINYAYGTTAIDRAFSICESSPSSSTLRLSGFSRTNPTYESALFLPVDKSTGVLSASALTAGTNTGDAEALASFPSSSGLVQAGFIFTSTDTYGSAFAIKYPTTSSPCQIGIPTFVTTNNNFSILYHDSIGSDTLSAFPLASPLILITDSVAAEQEVFCGTVGIEEITQINSLELFPNPGSTFLKIKISVKSNKVIPVTIVDMKGSTIFNLQIEGDEQEINISTLPPGIYHIIANTGVNLFQQKFIKLD